MKTIRRKNGEVSRVSDDIAAQLVSGGAEDYCPKKEWKKEQRSKRRKMKVNLTLSNSIDLEAENV